MNLLFRILGRFLGTNILNNITSSRRLSDSELRELQLDKLKHLGEIK